MSLVYNEDERMLQDAAQSFLGERAPVAALRKLRELEIETAWASHMPAPAYSASRQAAR